MILHALVPLAASLALAATTGSAAAANEPQARALRFGGWTRSYTVFLPVNYAAARSVPLVVDLHGFTSTADGQRAVSGYFALHADPIDGFAVVYPQGVGNSWNAGEACCGQAAAEKIDDVGFLVEMVHRILAEWPKIDPGRVYATGLSNGSAMVQRLGVEASETFVAGAGYAMRLITPPPDRRRPFAYVDFAGYQDTVVRYAGGGVPSVGDNTASWVRLQGCKPAARIEPMSPPGTAEQPNQCVFYEGCQGGVVVGSCSLSGGHILYSNWDEIDVARMGWRFLKRFRR